MNDPQDTEVVASERTGAASRAPGILNRPLPRAVTIPAAVVLGLAALLLLLNWGVLHVYQKHFSEVLPAARIPWNQLSQTLDEPALRAMLPELKLNCIAEHGGLGDRVCYSAVSRVDGYPALTVALFLRGGRLTLAMVHVPWWAHGRAGDALERSFGRSQAASAGGSKTLSRWTLPGGYVDMNQHRSLNPLSWSAIVWTPRK